MKPSIIILFSLLSLGCAPKVTIKQSKPSKVCSTAVLGILPIETGLYVGEDSVLNNLDRKLPRYFSNRTCFEKVIPFSSDSRTRQDSIISMTVKYKRNNSLEFNFPISRNTNRDTVDYLLAIKDFKFETKSFKVKTPTPPIPVPGAGLVVAAIPFQSNVVDCSLEFAVWDCSQKVILSYGRIEGTIAVGIFRNPTYDAEQKAIDLIDKIIDTSPFMKKD